MSDDAPQTNEIREHRQRIQGRNRVLGILPFGIVLTPQGIRAHLVDDTGEPAVIGVHEFLEGELGDRDIPALVEALREALRTP